MNELTVLKRNENNEVDDEEVDDEEVDDKKRVYTD